MKNMSSFDIRVKIQDGWATTLEVSPEESIRAVTTKFKLESGGANSLSPLVRNPDSAMCLMLEGEKLEDKRLLRDYQIQYGAKLIFGRPSNPIWFNANFLLSQVAHFLTLKDIVTLLSALRYSVGSTKLPMLVASAELLSTIVRRAVEPSICVDSRLMRWTQISHAQHEQMVALDELRMLHHLCSAIPTDLRLTSDGRCYLMLGSRYAPMASSQSFWSTAQGVCATIVFSACIQNRGVGVEAMMDCRRCSHSGCLSAVLRTCPACKEICSSCQREKHAKKCNACNQDVCRECVVPDETIIDDDPAEYSLCTACGFQCFVCFSAIRNMDRFVCSAGADCRTPNRPCSDCVFENDAMPTVGCERCDREWCEGCVQLPVCSGCNHLRCEECVPVRRCGECNLAFHDSYHGQLECWMNNGGDSCDVCEVDKCENCSDIRFCEYCNHTICPLCRPTFECPNETHGNTCRDCVDLCRKEEAKWGGSVDTNCRGCFLEAYAKLKGFESGRRFVIDSLLALEASKALEACSQLTSTQVQYWFLDGKAWDFDDKLLRFDTCSALWGSLDSMAHYRGLSYGSGPRPLSELLAGIRLKEIMVTSTAELGNRILCDLDVFDADNQLLETKNYTEHKMGANFKATPRSELQDLSLLKLDAEADERIVSVHTRADRMAIHSIQIVTSTGRSISCGGPGGDSGQNWTVPLGWKLVGFFGGMGAHLHHLGVVIVADEKPPVNLSAAK